MLDTAATQDLKTSDANADAHPGGFAIRFVLSEDDHTHYEIITNTANSFAVSTGGAFLAQFQATLNNKKDGFYAQYPHAKYFDKNVKTQAQWPHSLATEQFYGIHAFQFVNEQGTESFFRWRIVPVQGVLRYSKADAEAQGKDYLYDDLENRLTNNKPIKYRLMAPLAEDGDAINDSTKVWPESKVLVEMDEIRLSICGRWMRDICRDRLDGNRRGLL